MRPDPLGFWGFLFYDYTEALHPNHIDYAIDRERGRRLWSPWVWTDVSRRRARP